MDLKWKLGALFLLSALVMLWPASANSTQSENRPTEPLLKGTKVRDGLRKRLGAE